MWILFLLHNQWVQKIQDDDGNEKWFVTDKGKTWIEKVKLDGEAKNTISPPPIGSLLVLDQQGSLREILARCPEANR